MSGYEQAMALLAIIILGFSAVGLYYAAKVRELDVSIQKHELLLAEQRAREAAALHAAE